MRNQQTIQGIISVIAVICLAAGWVNIFSPEVSNILSKRVFYVIIGISFVLQAPFLSNKNFIYPMYAAAGLCIIGAFMKTDSQLEMIKTIGLFAGVLLSIFSRPRMPRQQ